MHRKKSIVSWVIAVSLLLVLTAGNASAATLTQSTIFEGSLRDTHGLPLTGKFTVTFRLYSVSSGGFGLATDTHNVTATDGYFRTNLSFPAKWFTGQALWVGIQRKPDPELSSRIEIRPVPYALSLRPGAKIQEAFFTTSQAGNGSLWRSGVNVTTAYSWNPGMTITTTGNRSNGVDVNTSRERSRGVHILTGGNLSEGVYARTSGTDSDGVYARTSGFESEGVYAETSGTNSQGVYAQTYGNNSEGVYALTSGTSSEGVYAQTSGTDSDGVYALTYGNNSEGVYALTYGNNSEGVHARTSGTDSDGVYARTSGFESEGVYVQTSGRYSAGVHAQTSGLDSEGVYAFSLLDNGILAETGRDNHKYGLYTPDYIYAKGTQYPASDVAEYMPVIENATPGTVLIIGEDGRLAPSAAAYDTRVAGIVSTDPGIFLGTKEDGNTGEALIAIAGRVPCRVDATKTPIRAGDLLTTSDIPGYAMKAEPTIISGRGFYPDGTVLGKAMGSLDSGTGTIEVLVTLQ